VSLLPVLIALMLAGLTPPQVALDEWAVQSAPYFESVTGITLTGPHLVSLQYLPGGGGATGTTTAGCTRTHAIDPSELDDPRVYALLDHELAHSYQGPACVAWEPYRVGGNLLRRHTSRANIEIGAQLIALEAAAERYDEPGGDYAFWRLFEFIASDGPGWYYHSGPLSRFLESRGGPVSVGLSEPVIMDDAWKRLGEAAWLFAESYGAR
jgi:hypothetical protein